MPAVKDLLSGGQPWCDLGGYHVATYLRLIEDSRKAESLLGSHMHYYRGLIITNTILGVPYYYYYIYSTMGPQALFELLRPLY